MKVDPKDIPTSESLLEIRDEIEINFDSLISFREKYTADEIIDYIANHNYFTVDNYPKKMKDEGYYKGEPLAYCNAIKSLIVTWDQLALESYEKLLLLKPGLFTTKQVVFSLLDSAFHDENLLMAFAERIRVGIESGTIAKYTNMFGLGKSPEDFVNHRRFAPPQQWKKATPAEELRKKKNIIEE